MVAIFSLQPLSFPRGTQLETNAHLIMQLQDKVAFVTGAGSGIGKASALLFAQEGAKVVAMSRTLEEVQATADEIKAAGGEAIAIDVDISKAEDIQRAVAATIEAFGKIDIVFANAGINGVWAPIEEISDEEWDKTIDINLKGTFMTLKYTFPHLKKQDRKSVV